MKVAPIGGKRREHGVVLLSLLLVLLAAGSYVLLRALNVATTATDDAARTRAALVEAKRALINYSIYKPNLNLGPGRLPCPDLAGDGSAAGSCVLGGTNATTGRFPHATVDSGHLRDSSGAELWYAVADSHRNFLTTPINSDTGDASDDLSVDGNDGIVAIVIAPSDMVGAQDRSSGADISDYLEGENASLADGVFSSTGGSEFNDQVITITRDELMVEVENRVLGDVQNSLNKYYEHYGGFPWSAPFSDPSTSVFQEVVGNTEGHLAIHRNGVAFLASFSLSWNIPVDGSLRADPGPRDECMRSSACDDQDLDILYDFSLTPLTFTNGSCLWTTAEDYNCTGTIVINVAGGELERTVTIELNLPGQAVAIGPPTVGVGRIRTINLAGPMPENTTGSIAITDALDGTPRGVERTLTFVGAAGSSGDNVTITLDDVPFLLGDDADIVSALTNSPAALPRWFTDNNWHRYVYYSYAANEAPGGSGCTQGVDCLTLNSHTTDLAVPDIAFDNVKGVAIVAGADTGSARPSANIVDYY
ncbi:MAG: hypothetical protein ACI915_005607, partial [Gammaproteobacteria bacterium]